MPEVVACRARRSECTEAEGAALLGTRQWSYDAASRGQNSRGASASGRAADVVRGCASWRRPERGRASGRESTEGMPRLVSGRGHRRGPREDPKGGCQEAAQGSGWATSNKGVVKGRGRRRRLTIGLPAPAACGGLRCNRRHELGDGCGSRLRCDLS